MPEDLRDGERLLELHRQAVETGLVTSSEADRLTFLAAAAHAQAVGSKPCRLFAWMVRGRRFEFITQADEDAARARLKEHLAMPRFATAPSRPAAPPGGPPETLSPDALLARSVLVALDRAGYRGDPLPLVRRENPEWTRTRWEVAVAELRDARRARTEPGGLKRLTDGIIGRLVLGRFEP